MLSFCRGSIILSLNTGFPIKDFGNDKSQLEFGRFSDPIVVTLYIAVICHPRGGGDPEFKSEMLDSRLRGNDRKI